MIETPKYHISVVSPVYKAAGILPELVQRIDAALANISPSYEIILVDDGCPEDSWSVIANLAKKYSHLKGIKLSRNFGQHHAIKCGLEYAMGDWIVVMDCDLQDRPEEITNLYNKANEGFDIVFARRAQRVDEFQKKTSSIIFYKIFSFLTGIEYDGTIANFGIYSKKAIEAVNSMREPMRAFSPMIRWVGFEKTAIDVSHDKRYSGQSSYNFSRLVNLAIDISLTYSDKPLKIIVKIGFFISAISVLYAGIIIVRYYLGHITQSGYSSLMVSIWFLSGLIIFILGIIGMYISKIFDGIKNRPLYLIDKVINGKF